MRLIICFILLIVRNHSFAQEKTGFVDSQKVMDTLPEKKIADSIIQATSTLFMLEYNHMQQLFNAWNPRPPGGCFPVRLTEEEEQQFNAETMREYNYIQKKLSDTLKWYCVSLQNLSDSLYQKTKLTVTEQCRILLKKHELTLLIDTRTVLYYSPELNYTNEIINQLLSRK